MSIRTAIRRSPLGRPIGRLIERGYDRGLYGVDGLDRLYSAILGI